MWRSPAERLALLELLARGTLKKRRSQERGWEVLSELPWVKRTGRRDELGLVEARRSELVLLLDRVWPAWGGALATLTAHGLPPTPEGWNGLEDAARAEVLPILPARINRRTAAALVARHSKSALTQRRLAALGDAETTHDGSVRMRPPAGLIGKTPRGAIDLSAVAAVLGEISLPERALKGKLELVGPIRAVLLVENLGAFCDLPPLDGWLLAHVAGWDTVTVVRLLERLIAVPVIHFGDLDPNGVRILQHLRSARTDVRWFVPEYWCEFVESRGLPGRWPVHLDVSWAPKIVQDLSRRAIWLEQEPIAVDSRTPEALEKFLADGG